MKIILFDKTNKVRPVVKIGKGGLLQHKDIPVSVWAEYDIPFIPWDIFLKFFHRLMINETFGLQSLFGNPGYLGHVMANRRFGFDVTRKAFGVFLYFAILANAYANGADFYYFMAKLSPFQIEEDDMLFSS